MAWSDQRQIRHKYDVGL